MERVFVERRDGLNARHAGGEHLIPRRMLLSKETQTCRFTVMAFLNHGLMLCSCVPAVVTLSRLLSAPVATDEQGPSFALNITDGLTDTQLRRALAPLEAAPVIELSQAEHLLCGLSGETLPEGWGWERDAGRFRRQLRKVLDHKLWCAAPHHRNSPRFSCIPTRCT